MKVRLDSPQVPQVFLRISSGSSGVTASSRLAPSLCVIHHFKHPQCMLIYVCRFLKDLLRFLRFSSGFSGSPQVFLMIFSGSSGFLMNLLRLHRFSSGSPQVPLRFLRISSGSPQVLLRFLRFSSDSRCLMVSQCLSPLMMVCLSCSSSAGQCGEGGAPEHPGGRRRRGEQRDH